MDTRHEPESPAAEEQPPFGAWTQWYLAVILTLVGLIVLFYMFTRMFE